MGEQRDGIRRQRLTRRQFLALLGIGTAAGAAAGMTGVGGLFRETPTGRAGGDTSCDYDTITVSSGETFSRTIGSGETFEKKVIDVSASGADVNIRTSGQDWTIRNIGFRGQFDVGTDPMTPTHSFVFHLNGSGTVENLYMGDGIESGADGKKGAFIYAAGAGSGNHTVMRNCNIGDFVNGVYAAGGAADGRPTLGVEHCYFEDCASNHLRVAEQGTYAEDSVFVTTSEGGYHRPDGTRLASRGFWPYRYGTPSDTVEIRNCQLDFSAFGRAIVCDHENAAGYRVTGGNLRGDVTDPHGKITMEDVGDTPDTSIPDGIPQSPEGAACCNWTSDS